MLFRRIALLALIAHAAAACSSDDQACVGCRLPEIEWKRMPGIGGTEIRSLVEFDGKILAGNGIWMETDNALPDQPGPQVFVLDKPESEGGAWQADFELTERVEQLNGLHRYITISAMQAITFERDAAGNEIPQPVDLLVASVWDHYDATEIFVRDVTGEWNETTLIEHSDPPILIAPGTCHRHIRSFVQHRDSVTGADMVFAGTNSRVDCPTRIYNGVYDPDVPGSIAWNMEPEPWEDEPGSDDRVLAMAVANGRLYATVCGKLYQRQDGPDPSWKMVYVHPDDNCPAGPGENGFRGTTAIAGARGDDLMVAMEGWQPHIGRIELLPETTHHEELDTAAYLQDQWGYVVGYAIVAYNEMTPFEMGSGETVLLMGLEASTPADPEAWNGWAPDAWYFVRYPDAGYELREIVDESIQPRPKLVSTRTFLPSPFDSEKGRVIYAGGFDANHKSCHDTAWLYRGELVD